MLLKNFLLRLSIVAAAVPIFSSPTLVGRSYTSNRIRRAPAPPVLLSPVNGAQGTATSTTLRWQGQAGVSNYSVYFGTMPQPPYAGSTGATTYNVSGLSQGATYYWYVVAISNGRTASSATYSFTTAVAAPAPPVLVSPANAAQGIATTASLEWQAEAAATSYDVYLGTAAQLPLAGSTSGSTYSVSGLTGGATYSWYVVARNSSGSAQSAVWSFTTAAPSTPPGVHPAMEYTADTEIMSAGGWPVATPAKTYPIPGAPPAAGRAGTYIVDTSIPTNTRILRVTDADDIAALGASPNATFATPALGDRNVWGADNKHALYLDNDAGSWYVLTLDLGQFPNPGTIVSKRRLPVYDLSFSYTNPDYIYGRSGAVFQRYQISTGQITNLFDASTIRGWDFTPAYQSYFALSGDDQWMCLLDGIQDEARIVACYNQATGARRLLDIAAGAIDGQPIGTAYPATAIHGIDFGSGASLFIMAAGGATNTTWELNKPLSIIPEETVWTNNHSATGVNGLVRGHSPVASDSRGFVYKPLSQMNNTTAWYELNPAVPAPTNWDNENHLSWSNNDPANPDKAPVIIQTALKYAHSTTLWLDNEIFAMRMDGVQQQVWHFFHTYTRVIDWGCPTYLTSPHPSRDGKWVLFNSDWNGTLGSGSPSCGYRMDVFLAELK